VKHGFWTNLVGVDYPNGLAWHALMRGSRDGNPLTAKHEGMQAGSTVRE